MATNNRINSVSPILQVVSTSTSASSSLSTAIPYDNTIPQITEGTEVLSLAITPKSSTSTLAILFYSFGEKSTAGSATVALFQDATTDALASKGFLASTGYSLMFDFQHYMTSGTTSSTTFRIRLGPAANTYRYNGDAVGRLYGGVASTNLTIIEYL